MRKRIFEHSQGVIKGFTQKYNLKYLMYYEVFDDVLVAIQREKSLKGKSRKKKESIISVFNPDWRDRSSDIL